MHLITVRTDMNGANSTLTHHSTFVTSATPLALHKQLVLQDREDRKLREKDNLTTITTRSIIMACPITPEEAAYLGFDADGNLPE